ncbi:hypothetical protein R3P38DRAFT_3322519 [Favolaschia claudopus]|uniref:DNA breaking-rejoining enzyme n=1 Tax=Favolaschia claudopus TaxID=2862362 RepID=A0AAW0AKT5_9AGAR
MSSEIPPIFTTIYQAIHNASEEDRAYSGEIEDDIEAEGETLPEDSIYDVSQLQEHLLDASKGVTNETDKEYRRLMKQCLQFLKDNKLIQDDNKFFSKSPSALTPFCICAWIMHECDERDFDGTKKDSQILRESYAHAQKMRAAMTYAFGRLHGLGSLPWHESEATGRMVGNPSVSETVATYMTSLRRRKARVIFRSYHQIDSTSSNLRRQRNDNTYSSVSYISQLDFGTAVGHLSRPYLQNVSLWIQNEKDIHFHLHVLTEFLGIKPFYLHLFPPHLAHLCPIRALANWLEVADIEDGFLLRKIASGDRVSRENVHMTSECFLEMFRNNLLDIGTDSAPYGTHSFRRGGCQWLYSIYLISYAVEPAERREDYMNPNRPPALKCFSCGRTCHCI